MPKVEENLALWNQSYDWSQAGEEWSAGWGGSESQWFCSLLPRIRAFMPTGTILEIAPGFGRWTQYLKDCCKQLIIVDLAEECIKACKTRFSDCPNLTYHVNDGKSLAMIPNGSVDFVFSFDSLVHAEADVLEAYLSEIAHKLKPDGVGFIHHSNVGNYHSLLSLMNRIPETIRVPLIEQNYLLNKCWHAESMTAELFEIYCQKAGLQCVSQEMINWCHRRYLIGCISTFTHQRSIWARPNRIFKNKDFVFDMMRSRLLSPYYSSHSFIKNPIK